ncbi:MAG: heavy metal-binding domain-containing protein, partial [Candidatus Angelobacter sp.]
MNPVTTMVEDPVCKMKVDPAKASGSSEYKGKTYYFCSPGCERKFTAGPEKYLSAKPETAGLVSIVSGAASKPASAMPASAPASSGKGTVTYVCPMDPEVRERQPGPCPRCGMALEAQAVEYTCPMHPQVISDKPGNCPTCGMALEPRTVAAAGEEDDSELRSMTRRFWAGVALSVPLLALSMGS